MGKIAVIALGGNALRKKGEPLFVEHQLKNIRHSVDTIVELVKSGIDPCITHGNGPQVGIEFFRNVYLREKLPVYPLDLLNAETQGWIGYAIVRNLKNKFKSEGIERETVGIVTQVLVDRNDPAFKKPEKPIGDFFSKEEAQSLMESYPWEMVEDAGRGWRVVVPSPQPLKIVEGETIKTLVKNGTIVIAVGGGGIPVTYDKKGTLVGVEAVIDKDWASTVLALEIGAELLFFLTEVKEVYLNYRSLYAAPIRKMNVEEAKNYLKTGHFPPGSMGPKIEAAIEFLEKGGKEVIITSIESAPQALTGEAGTHIFP